MVLLSSCFMLYIVCLNCVFKDVDVVELLVRFLIFFEMGDVGWLFVIDFIVFFFVGNLVNLDWYVLYGLVRLWKNEVRWLRFKFFGVVILVEWGLFFEFDEMVVVVVWWGLIEDVWEVLVECLVLWWIWSLLIFLFVVDNFIFEFLVILDVDF